MFLWIGPCHCFPKRSSPNRTNGLPHLAVYRRNGLQWLETSTIQCQWIYSDNDLYLIKYNSDMRPCLSIVVLFPQIDCPRWLPHFPGPHLTDYEGVNPNSLWRHECTLWCDHGYNANANLWALTSVATHSVLIDAINMTKDLRTDRNQTSVNVESKRQSCFAQNLSYTPLAPAAKSLHPELFQDCKDTSLWRHQRTNNNRKQRYRSTGFAYFNCTVGCGLF